MGPADRADDRVADHEDRGGSRNASQPPFALPRASPKRASIRSGGTATATNIAPLNTVAAVTTTWPRPAGDE